MAQHNPKTRERTSGVTDAVREFTDSTGVRWRLTAEFKTFNERLDVSSLTISPKNLRSPITRRLLSEIPLDRLFRDDLALESAGLSKMLRSRKGSTAHPGRAHQDIELRTVAEIYRTAFMARLPVQQSVADALGISVSTAAKRIMAARQRGFISATKGAK